VIVHAATSLTGNRFFKAPVNNPSVSLTADSSLYTREPFCEQVAVAFFVLQQPLFLPCGRGRNILCRIARKTEKLVAPWKFLCYT
jgi:hypothetical protein